MVHKGLPSKDGVRQQSQASKKVSNNFIEVNNSVIILQNESQQSRDDLNLSFNNRVNLDNPFEGLVIDRPFSEMRKLKTNHTMAASNINANIQDAYQVRSANHRTIDNAVSHQQQQYMQFLNASHKHNAADFNFSNSERP